MPRRYLRTEVCEPAILTVMNSAGEREVYAVTVLDRSYKGLRVSLSVMLKPASSVKIRFDGRLEEAVVIYCRAEGDQYQAGISLPQGVERRKEPRFPVHTAARLTVFPKNEEPWTMEVSVADISKSGVGLIASRQLEAGTLVEFRLANSIAVGEIRNSAALPSGGYRIGVRFAQVVTGGPGITMNLSDALNKGPM